jgi:D-lactate dehydrogenase
MKQYQYDVLDTCAVDGLCATACPVDINTGDLVKRLRRENHSPFANKIALAVAKNFRTVERLARTALKTGITFNNLFGKNFMRGFTGAFRKVFPEMPLWSEQLLYPPDLGSINGCVVAKDAAIVYFPSCISRTLGVYEGKEKNLMETFLSICKKAGIGVNVLKNAEGSCCSQIFSSKGFGPAAQYSANKIIDQLWESSKNGQLPIVIDVSSCAYTLHHVRPILDDARKEKFDKLRILDSVEFLHDMVIPKSRGITKQKNIVVHPVCSLQKMKTEDKFVQVAKHFAAEVTVPVHAGCCGMAGDRGFLIPELTASATHLEAAEVQQRDYDGYYSSTKTCEMAISEAVKKNYESILYLVDESLA